MSFFRKKKKTKKRAKNKKPKRKIKKTKKVKKIKKVRPKIKTRKLKVKKMKKKAKSIKRKTVKKPKVKIKKKMLRKTVKAAKKKKGPTIKKMSDEKAFTILKRYKIDVPDYAFCKNEKELEAALKKVGYPCVMKVSGSIVHKTDVNGVRKNVTNMEDAVKHFKELIKIKGCDKVLVQKMVESGYELIIGGKKDPQFNRIVAFGAGGIFTEFLKDVSFRVAPLSKMDAEEMIKEVKFSELLMNGFRGQKPANVAAIKDVLLSVSKIMEKYKEINELDINPLFATPTKAIATDVRIITD